MSQYDQDEERRHENSRFENLRAETNRINFISEENRIESERAQVEKKARLDRYVAEGNLLGIAIETGLPFPRSVSQDPEPGDRLLDVDARVRKIIIDKLGVDESEVTSEASMYDLGGDSLDAIELIMEFEKEFNISIPDDHADTITTVGQAMTYLRGAYIK